MMWCSPFDYHYIILDCALPHVREQWYLQSNNTNSAALLYAETRFASMLDISPLIAPTDENDPFLHWLYEHQRELHIENWGCLLHSKADPETIAAHFRSWITVYDDVGQEVFFRFYDPDILPCFAAALEGEERQKFFGPVNAFMCRRKDKDLLQASQARRPEGWSFEQAEPLGPCPCFSFQERHMAAMRPVFWPFLVREVGTSLIPHACALHLTHEQFIAKLEECLQSLADMQQISLPEVEDGVAFCLLAFTSCSHFFQSQEFRDCVRRQGMHETLDEWKRYAGEPIPGLEEWHDAEWLRGGSQG